MPKIISLHDVLEPLKQALLASRDVIISGQICVSKLQRVFTLGDGCWLPIFPSFFRDFWWGSAGAKSLVSFGAFPCLASQAAWYRMENGPKAENGKELAEKKKWPTARNGGKMAQKQRKKGDLWSFFYFFAILGPFFPHFGPWAIFFFSANSFPFLAFGPFSILYQAAWLAILALFRKKKPKERKNRERDFADMAKLT